MGLYNKLKYKYISKMGLDAAVRLKITNTQKCLNNTVGSRAVKITISGFELYR